MILAWLSWRSTDPEPGAWAAMRSRARARSRFEGVEHKGAGWRVYCAPTRQGEVPVYPDDSDESLWVLDRAEEPTVRGAPTPTRVLDGSPCAALRIDSRLAQISLFRDPLGQRPLVYAAISGGVLVASGEHVLRAHPQISDQYDEDYLAAYFCALPPAHDATIYQQIRCVPAGAKISISASGVQQLRTTLAPAEFRRGSSDGEVVEQFGELLQAAVAKSVYGAHRVGLSLSAGIDSSAVAAALPEPRSAIAVTYSFPSWPQIDERALVERCAAQLQLSQISFDADSLLPLAPSLARPVNPDTPLASIYREIKEAAYLAFVQAGAPLWLDGGFGDHLAAPADDWLYAGLRDRRWSALSREAAYRWSSSRPLRQDPGLRRLARRLLPRASTVPGGLERLQPHVRKRLVQRWHEELAQYGHFPRPAQAMSALNGYAMAAASGEQYYAQRHGMEQRSPFRDLELTRWMLGLPEDLLHRCGEHKWLLRRWLSTRVDAPIYGRRKSSDLTPFLASAVRSQRARWQTLTESALECARTVLTPTALTNSSVERQLLFRWLLASFGQWSIQQDD